MPASLDEESVSLVFRPVPPPSHPEARWQLHLDISWPALAEPVPLTFSNDAGERIFQSNILDADAAALKHVMTTPNLRLDMYVLLFRLAEAKKTGQKIDATSLRTDRGWAEKEAASRSTILARYRASLNILVGNVDGEHALQLRGKVQVTLPDPETLKAFREWVGSGESPQTEQERFRQFFGPGVHRSDSYFVFPHRPLDESGRWPFKTPEWLKTLDDRDLAARKLNGASVGKEGKRVTRPKSVEGSGPVGEGIFSWLAVEDVAASNYVVQLLARNGAAAPRVVLDAKIVDSINNIPAVTAFAFGLGNELTHRLSLETSCQLYRLFRGPSPKKPNDDAYETDNFLFGPGAMLPTLEDGWDHAIVARIVLDKSVFFVCAGRTATGTACAGNYVLRKWRLMYNCYADAGDLERRSMALLIRYNDTGERVYESGTSDLGDNMEPAIEWWAPHDAPTEEARLLAHVRAAKAREGNGVTLSSEPRPPRGPTNVPRKKN